MFRAWWYAAEDLRNPALSVTGFRFALEGAMGTAAVWAAIRGAAQAGHMPPEEAWFYGAELLRTLREVNLAEDDARETPAKRELLSAFRERVQAESRLLLADQTENEVLQKVKAFYAETGEASGR